MLDSLQTTLFQIEQLANQLVSAQLSQLSLLSLAIIFTAGLLTSLTPCTLSMLPITVAYIGGYAADENGQPNRARAAIQSIWFAFGLATTLAGLGLVAGIAGRIYGQIGTGLTIGVSLVAILMGLNLLEALPLQLPRWSRLDNLHEKFPTGLRSYGLGLTFGLVASPCSTPVLATLLAWISSQQDPVLGAGLLLAYTAGYTMPLVIAGTFTAAIKQFLALRKWSAWINPTSGALLVGFGVFSLLTRLMPVV
jgi:cytochrome c-type biogenesis protein